MDSSGTQTQGVLEAENQAQALALVRGKGLFPTQIAPVSGKGATAPAARVQAAGRGLSREIKMPRLFRPRVKAKELTVFTRQLATLQDAGLPLLRGLRILLKQTRNPTLREALNGMSEAVEGGSTFSEALSLYPHIFDKLFVSMVKAGEAGGVLEVVLLRLAEFAEKAERIKNRVKKAMIYPIVVLVATVGILSFLLINVIPKFEDIFQDLLQGEALPPLTQFVISASRVVKDNVLVVLVAVAGLVVGLKLWRRTTTGRMFLDRLKLKMPLFGPLFTKTAVARFSRTLGTLLSSGVPILQALNIVRETAGNEVVAHAIQQVHDSVKEGDTMAMPLEASGVFPSMVVSMVDVGEETGALPEMLGKVADAYEDEVDTAVEGLTSILEPILIMFMAVVVGTIVIAMFVPLVTIIGRMSQQG